MMKRCKEFIEKSKKLGFLLSCGTCTQVDESVIITKVHKLDNKPDDYTWVTFKQLDRGTPESDTPVGLVTTTCSKKNKIHNGMDYSDDGLPFELPICDEYTPKSEIVDKYPNLF